jgi:hypothetical protein
LGFSREYGGSDRLAEDRPCPARAARLSRAQLLPGAPPMVAIAIIFGFLIIVAALNLIEFGRVD